MRNRSVEVEQAMKLGDWLREKRMTHEELADRIGCNHTTISRLIRKAGKKQVRKPSFRLAEKIAVATGGAVTANDFVEDEHEAA